MSVRDLSAFFDAGLDYPGVPSKTHPDGKTYKVPSPDAKTGLWLAGIANVGLKARLGEDLTDAESASILLDDDDERTLYQRVLGPTYDEMLSDGVDWLVLQRIGQDAFLCFSMSEQTADLMLTQGKAQAAPERRANNGKPTAGRKSARVSGGSANPTRRRASTGSSTSRTGPEATAV